VVIPTREHTREEVNYFFFFLSYHETEAAEELEWWCGTHAKEAECKQKAECETRSQMQRQEVEHEGSGMRRKQIGGVAECKRSRTQEKRNAKEEGLYRSNKGEQLVEV
jgi:hypothetical protein